MDAILAKKTINNKTVSLLNHTQSVLKSVELMFGSRDRPTSLGKSWLNFFQVDESEWQRFIDNLYLASLFHDIGKANDGFQRVLLNKGNQVIRHEHLSGLILNSETFKEWFETLDQNDRLIILAAVIGHHVKSNHESFGAQLVEGEQKVWLYLSSPDVLEVMKLANNIMGKSLSLKDVLWDIADIQSRCDGVKKEAFFFKHRLREDLPTRRLLLGVKAALIAVDAAGSALTREEFAIEQWLNNCFYGEPLTGEWLNQHIIQPRISDIENHRKRKFIWHDFQISAGNLGERALLLSGCGTGKTLAAWKWIQSQLERKPAKRIIFLYPTRATATEGFRDYVSWAGGEYSALQHGTSEYDLDGMFANPGDIRSGGDYHVQERLFALGYWPKRVFSATVDSFLAFMQNQYASLCMLPVLCDSVVVIDEAHSFDRHMFAALERFLNFFVIPTLVMTATLPEDRKKILEKKCKLEIYPSEKTQFVDLEKQASYPRYRVEILVNQEKALEICAGLFLDGEETRQPRKLLWVVNTVQRCQRVAAYLKKKLNDIEVLCYHSRFRLMDRKEKHEEVIKKFRGNSSLILVTTQLCEMSLDLDADIEISEVAPIPSLIQRMGRSCRQPYPPNGRVGEIYLYLPADSKPYQREEIEQALGFAETLAKKEIPWSQAELTECLKQMEVINPFASDGHVGFIDSGFWAMSEEESFRESDEFTVDCVLDTDIDTYWEMKKNKDPKGAGLVIPVPRKFTEEDPRLGKYLRRANGAQYDKQFGFMGKEVTDV
jgi:CRISPR-associated endonuclease/helicase Cas3